MLLQKKHVLPNMLPLLLCSLLSYAPYLIQTQIVPLPYVAVAVLAIAIITFVDLVLALYTGPGKREGEEAELS